MSSSIEATNLAGSWCVCKCVFGLLPSASRQDALQGKWNATSLEEVLDEEVELFAANIQLNAIRLHPRDKTSQENHVLLNLSR